MEKAIRCADSRVCSAEGLSAYAPCEDGLITTDQSDPNAKCRSCTAFFQRLNNSRNGCELTTGGAVLIAFLVVLFVAILLIPLVVYLRRRQARCKPAGVELAPPQHRERAVVVPVAPLHAAAWMAPQGSDRDRSLHLDAPIAAVAAPASRNQLPPPQQQMVNPLSHALSRASPPYDASTDVGVNSPPGGAAVRLHVSQELLSRWQHEGVRDSPPGNASQLQPALPGGHSVSVSTMPEREEGANIVPPECRLWSHSSGGFAASADDRLAADHGATSSKQPSYPDPVASFGVGSSSALSPFGVSMPSGHVWSADPRYDQADHPPLYGAVVFMISDPTPAAAPDNGAEGDQMPQPPPYT